MKNKKRSVLFTIIINLLFIAAITAVGWKIYDYVNDSRQTTELAEELWEQAAITAAPSTEENGEKAVTEVMPVDTEFAQTVAATAQSATEKNTEKTSIVVDPETGKKSDRTSVAIDPAAAENTGNTSNALDPATELQSANTSASVESATAEISPESAEQKPDVKNQTEVYNETYTTENTPNPEEKNNGKVHSAFLNMLNTTPTPAPTPRFTDMPDIPAGIDFDKLAKTNKDVAGWLYHPGIGVNLPVVQGPDNEYYLRRGFSGYHRQAGTLFIDYRNNGDFSDRNTIIYGHGRRDLTMFGKLHYYKNAEFCEKYPFFYLYIPGHRYRLEIVATGYTKDASDYYSLPAGDYWDELLDRLMEQSPYDFGIPISPDDHYVTLSTCAYDYQDERWIVIARIDDPDGTLP